MKAAGIVVEYNPMHYGHMHHYETTRAKTGADIVIAVMSTHMVQRGEFSIADKFTKTLWALKAGIDIVVELPGVLSLQSADRFAYASVSLLDALGVNVICFGSEQGNTDQLNYIVDYMATEQYNEVLKAHLDAGKSFPSSNARALEAVFGQSLSPNDTLGVQYIRALRALNSTATPLAIPRIASGYYEEKVANERIQSATAIRKMLANHESIASYVPDFVAKTIKSFPTNGDLLPFLRYKLIATPAETLKATMGFEEGIENRFKKALDVTTYDDLLEKLITPRYTNANIKRTLMHALIGTQKRDITRFDVPYIRVLGMNENGQHYLSHMKKTLTLPLITKIKQQRHRYLDYELLITQLYDLFAKTNHFKKEFEPVIMY